VGPPTTCVSGFYGDKCQYSISYRTLGFAATAPSSVYTAGLPAGTFTYGTPILIKVYNALSKAQPTLATNAPANNIDVASLQPIKYDDSKEANDLGKTFLSCSAWDS
jgi:hypothetical protein